MGEVTQKNKELKTDNIQLSKGYSMLNDKYEKEKNKNGLISPTISILSEESREGHNESIFGETSDPTAQSKIDLDMRKPEDTSLDTSLPVQGAEQLSDHNEESENETKLDMKNKEQEVTQNETVKQETSNFVDSVTTDEDGNQSADVPQEEQDFDAADRERVQEEEKEEGNNQEEPTTMFTADQEKDNETSNEIIRIVLLLQTFSTETEDKSLAYQVLKLDKNKTTWLDLKEDVDWEYGRLYKLLHPDNCKLDGGEIAFGAVKKAKQNLTDYICYKVGTKESNPFKEKENNSSPELRNQWPLNNMNPFNQGNVAGAWKRGNPFTKC